MRCSANGASLRHKATFPPGERFRKRNLHLISQLTLTPVSLRLGQAWLLTSPGGQFTTKPLLRSPQGEAKVGIVPRGAQNKRPLPRIQKPFPLCTTSLSLPPPVAPVPRGVSGGGAALSPGFQLNLCSLPKHGAHSAAQSPECAFLRRFRVSGFCLRSFAQAKNGVNLRRRSHKISVTKAKTA